MIFTPENSFVQFNNTNEEGCAVQFSQCLPVVRSSDINFQLIIDSVEAAPGPNDYVLKLFSDCDINDPIEMPVGPYSSTDIFATILWSHIADDDTSYGIITINQDFNFAQILEDQECFYIGVVRVNGDNYEYENFYGVSGTDVTVAIVIDGVTNSAVVDISDINDIAAAIQQFTDDNVQVQIAFYENIERIIIHSLDGKVYGNITVGATVYTAEATENEDDLITCSNCFKYNSDECFTTVISYRCNENAFGFNYEVNEDFENIVRLPINIDKPQPVITENVFRFSNGTYKTLSSTHEKEFEGKTEWFSEAMHFRLSIALKHDSFGMKRPGELRFTSYVCEGAYEIEWVNDPGISIDAGQGKFKVKQYPYYQVNSNCQ